MKTMLPPPAGEDDADEPLEHESCNELVCNTLHTNNANVSPVLHASLNFDLASFSTFLYYTMSKVSLDIYTYRLEHVPTQRGNRKFDSSLPLDWFSFVWCELRCVLPQEQTIVEGEGAGRGETLLIFQQICTTILYILKKYC